ncbi:OmpA family protein [Acidovorax sp. 210-6]|uniref:OmpA family protein n=1 Tax=Acidovorax sp. 210-6 TaxID=2699468 RepID=UPI00138A4F7A|nr:OmpA family protein [Acidovorax sp. 210-6]NCU66926.1 OmpA family protein [Acidovorax sp. 210-6]
MKRRTHMPWWRPSGAASCLAIAACAATPPASIDPPAPTTTIAQARLAQRGHGVEAAFALCHGDACPQRTPKTLASVAAQPTAVAAPTVPPLPGNAVVELDAPPLIASASSRAPEAPVFEQVSVHFPFASAQLGPSARAALREVAPQLALASEITLSGRTDSTGPAAANDGLAKARAQAVLRELAALSPAIAPRVSVDAQGACCYAEPNNSPAGRANNRRVEIRYRIDGDDPP